MKVKTFLFVPVVCLLSLDATAASPKLSGNYAFSLAQTCQVSVGTDTYDNVDIGNPPKTITLANVFDRTLDDGKFSQAVVNATFNLSASTVSVSGLEVKGSVLLASGLSDPSEVMSAAPIAGSFSYSVPSSSSLVIGDVSYQAAYGNIVNGVARYVTFLAHDPSKPACSDYGTAVHQ